MNREDRRTKQDPERPTRLRGELQTPQDPEIGCPDPTETGPTGPETQRLFQGPQPLVSGVRLDQQYATQLDPGHRQRRGIGEVGG